MGEVGKVSLIWQGILNFAKENPQLVEFYSDNVRVKVGNGNKTKFWTDKWCNNRKFCEEFPRLFCISKDKEDSILQYRQRRGSSGN